MNPKDKAITSLAMPKLHFIQVDFPAWIKFCKPYDIKPIQSLPGLRDGHLSGISCSRAGKVGKCVVRVEILIVIAVELVAIASFSYSTSFLPVITLDTSCI